METEQIEKLREQFRMLDLKNMGVVKRIAVEIYQEKLRNKYSGVKPNPMKLKLWESIENFCNDNL